MGAQVCVIELCYADEVMCVCVCVCVCCAVPQLAEVMVWIMMLLFFAIWPCGFSLCSVVSKIHKGTLGLSVFECLHVCVRVFVCVHLLCGSFMTVLFFLLTVWFWSNAACSINLTYKVINPAFSSFFLSRFSFLSLFFFFHVTIFPSGLKPFCTSFGAHIQWSGPRSISYYQIPLLCRNLYKYNLVSQLSVLYFREQHTFSDGDTKLLKCWYCLALWVFNIEFFSFWKTLTCWNEKLVD